MATEPRVPLVPRSNIDDADLQSAMRHTDDVGTPPTTKLQAMAHAPDMAVAFASYWRTTSEGGRVDREVKELGRLTIAQLLGCDVCAGSRASDVDDLDEEAVAACALPDFDHPDPRTRAAVRYARTLVLDDGDDEERYRELHEHYDWGEIVELATFFCLVLGDVRMVQSLGLQPSS